MPAVRMLTDVAGPDCPAWHAGEIVQMTPEQAAVWADGERGELVRAEAAETPERRARRRETTARGGAPETA